MAVLPFRRRKSKAQRALDTAQSALKVYTSLKVAQAGPKAAKAVAKGYAGAKTAQGGAKVARILAVPVLLMLVVIVARKAVKGGGEGGAEPIRHDAPATPQAPPVSTGGNAPGAGAVGGPKSGTSTASPPRETQGPDAPTSPASSPAS